MKGKILVECEHCGQRIDKKSMARHLRIYHLNKPKEYKCEHCSQECFQVPVQNRSAYVQIIGDGRKACPCAFRGQAVPVQHMWRDIKGQLDGPEPLQEGARTRIDDVVCEIC